MMRPTLSILAALTAYCSIVPAQTFTDPAIPVVEKLANVPVPGAKKQDALKFHAAPKPLAANAVTHEWRDFLGPSLNGISTEKPLLQKFGKGGPPIVWEIAKGEGYASPAVVKGRVVLFHRLEEEEVVECLDAESGQRFWRHSYPTNYRDRYGFDGGPRCQPVSDGEWVYTFGAQGKLSCWKLTTGQLLWKRDIIKEWNLEPNFFGVGSTPLLEGNLLIVNVGADNGPCVAAFDKRSGKMVWGAGKEWGPSYASPIAATVQGKRRVFVFAGGESRPATGGVLCIDPATGKLDWSFPWRADVYESVNASSPLIVGNQVYVSECYGTGGVLLDVQPDGAVREVWRNNKLGTHFMTAIYKDGYIYGIDGHGPANAPLVCLDFKTGKEMWREDVLWEEIEPGLGGRRSSGPRKVKLPPGLASLILVDGRCLMLGEFGHLVWLDLNPQGYRELDRVRLFVDREAWTMPSLSRGLLYVNQNSKGEDGAERRLICYDLRAVQ